MTGPKNISVGDLRCHTDAQGNTQCEVEGNGASSAPCVSGRTKQWVSPGDAVHGQSAQIAEVFTDGGQSWARLTNGNVVPVCPNSEPSNATKVAGTSRGVSVGQVMSDNQDAAPSPPDVVGTVPTSAPTPQQVCPPGHTLTADGSCIVPMAVATPDPSCPPGHYLRESGECVAITFDPPPLEDEGGEVALLREMRPDMPPAATPTPGAVFDPRTGKLRAPGTMFDGMEVQPYGHGQVPAMYGGAEGARAVFFAMGVSKMFALVSADHGACCDACAVGGVCETKRRMNPADTHAARGSVRIRMGRPEPQHGHVTVRDRTTKIVTANNGYVFSLQPLVRPVEVFEDVYGRPVYVGKRVWSAPMPVPMSPAVSVGAAGPNVMRQGPTVPGGVGPSMAQSIPGLPPRNPEWQYKGPLDGVKF